MKYLVIAVLLLIAAIGAWNLSEGPQGEVFVQIDGDTVPEEDSQISPAITGKSTTAPTEGGGSVIVYDGISVPGRARELDLSGRGLTGSLKAEIRHLSELRVLDISDNGFTGLPAEVGQLTHLERLDLSNNPFTGLPQELGNLRELRSLDLRGTQYSTYDLSIIKAALPSSVEILTD